MLRALTSGQLVQPLLQLKVPRQWTEVAGPVSHSDKGSRILYLSYGAVAQTDYFRLGRERLATIS